LEIAKMVEENVNKYSEAISIGNYFMVEKLMELEKDETRKKKKENVYNEKKKVLLATFLDDKKDIINKTDRRNLFCKLLAQVRHLDMLTLIFTIKIWSSLHYILKFFVNLFGI